MARELEPWGGEVHMPSWLRRLLRRPAPAGATPEAAHEARKAQSTVSAAQNADRAAVGSLSELYAEGRQERRNRKNRG